MRHPPEALGIPWYPRLSWGILGFLICHTRDGQGIIRVLPSQALVLQDSSWIGKLWEINALPSPGPMCRGR